MRNDSGRPDSWLAELTKETAVVHTKHDGPSIKGVLSAVHADCLVISDGVVLDTEVTNVLDGSVVIPRENVSFLQVIAP